MAIKYKDVLPVANGLIIAGTFFFLGLLLGNWPYDAKTLFSQQVSQADFDNSLRHYQTWAQIPSIPLHIIHFFIGLGFIGMFIKLYKPSEDSKYFEYGSLLLYVLAVCVYLTNLRTGADSALHGEWGEVDANTGINVIAASSSMIVFLLGGIIMLQVGLYYGEWEYQQRLEIFNKEEAEREATEAAEAEKVKPSKGSSSSASKSETQAKQTKSKSSAGKRQA
ncbi:Secretory component protein SHR3 [Wickerhamomyces ciferrii]|uniref:Secretory component protein SHR3 n=1 Tax=Wickerhamomyces ciferrii (strain ATCC 14091 / BCRC 22168 / CBS 111 / JCM 3599 / NBRC 0793 / NRRL Y-1031 F-60-10) TaxID=1206466 RepID=K0KHR4_WICCF|nr:Secretory component protein SHR3 [Wickerhamomyces ciferrii]CCH44745.1 Secretory component protein SHR3 [Wickerhamomyces ciferrii]